MLGILRVIGPWWVGLLTPLMLCVPVGAQEFVRVAQARCDAAEAQSPERVRAHLDLAEVCLRYDVSRGQLEAEQALELAVGIGDVSGEVQAMSLVGRARSLTEGRQAAFDCLRRAEARSASGASQEALAWMQYAFASCHFLFDEIVECMERLRRATDAAESLGDPLLDCRTQLLVYQVIGYPADDPMPALEGLRDRLVDHGDLAEALFVDVMMMDVRQRYGHPAARSAELEKLLARAQDGGDRATQAFVGHLCAKDCTATKDGLVVDGADGIRRAQEFMADAEHAARRLGDPEVLGLLLEQVAQFELFRGDAEAAQEAITDGIAVFESIGLRARLHAALETAVQVASSAGQADLMREYHERAAAIGRELDAVNERERFWREASKLHKDARRRQLDQQQRIGQLSFELRRLAWVAGGVVLVLAAVVIVMLFRGKRRVELLNIRLVDEIRTASRAQEERAALEQNLRQQERLDSLGMLAGGFAHDFNNILAAVSGHAQLLMMAPEVPADAREQVALIVQASDRAAALCRDILTYARSDVAEESVVNVGEIIDGLVPIARAGFGAGIDLSIEHSVQDAMVLGDRSQLEQVFLNVLVNACESISDRGSIRVVVGTGELPTSPPTGHWFGDFSSEPRECVEVTIEDTGEGMDDETVQRIFDPFYSTRFPGRGLGLAAAYGILRRHAGVTWVRSEPGRGTTFGVLLPRVLSGERATGGRGSCRENRGRDYRRAAAALATTSIA